MNKLTALPPHTGNTSDPGPQIRASIKEDLRRARAKLRMIMREVNNWHEASSQSSLNIVAALYGIWLPIGASAGIERVVVVSKGHMAPALYAWLAAKGVIGDDELTTFAVPESRLQSHLDAGRLDTVVTNSTGSLGQGLSIANGIAFAAKVDGVRREVAVILGDGELDEGQVWEAAATASSLGLDNVVAVVDRNMIQHTGPTEAVKPKEPLASRWEAFGWYVMEVRNDAVDIAAALENLSHVKGRPKTLIVRWEGGRW